MEFLLSGLQLLIESDLNNVCLVGVAINRICLHLGLDDVQASNVELCIVEAVTNVIKHAYHGKPGEIVSVAVSSHIGHVDIEVRDQGIHMPSAAVAILQHGTSEMDLPGIDKSLLAESGRGLQIIHDIMNLVTYKREGNHNLLSLKKYIYPLCDS
jgi:serine/threonine-protein kinase RsbW